MCADFPENPSPPQPPQNPHQEGDDNAQSSATHHTGADHLTGSERPAPPDTSGTGAESRSGQAQPQDTLPSSPESPEQTDSQSKTPGGDELDDDTVALLNGLDDPMDETQERDEATRALLQNLDQLKINRPESAAQTSPPLQHPETTPPPRPLASEAEAEAPSSPAEITETPSPTPQATSPATSEAPSSEADMPSSLPEITVEKPLAEPDSYPPLPSEPVGAVAIEDSTAIQQRYRYRVAAQLPDTIKTAILEALRNVGLKDLATEGYLQFQADFTAENPQSLATTLDAWVQDHLPVETRLERVHSEVIGSQTYVAGWSLTNQDTIYQAQNALTRQLADIVTPDANTKTTFRALLPVLMDVPASAFPRLVGYLQHQFEPQALTIDAVELLHLPITDDGEPAEDASWEVMGVFRSQT
ncbi:MAG: hypothetical protein GYB66_05495 [Chloroflexi bacterium]|nr:hypothetical protein [Chloroflexota bacterium]